MENGVMELVEMLHQMVSEAWGIPLGADKCVIERDRFLDILEELKAQLPGEIEESKKLMAARQEYIASAKREAESIRRVAEEHARQMVDEQVIIQQAKNKAGEVLSTAEAKSTELKRMANEYAEDALRRTEEVISAALNEVRSSRSRFHSVAAGGQVREAASQMPLDPDEEI